MSISISFNRRPENMLFSISGGQTTHIHRPVICNSYLMLVPDNLPSMSTDEFTVLELVANLKAFEPNMETVTSRELAELLELHGDSQARRVVKAVSGLVNMGFLERVSRSAVTLCRSVRLRRPSKINRVFVPIHNRGEIHRRHARSRRAG